MQRQRGELAPIGEVVTGLDDELVPAIREAAAPDLGVGETTDFDGKAKNPHHGPNQGRTRGGSLDAVRALRPARAGGHRRSVVQEMPPGRQQKNWSLVTTAR